MSKLQLKIIGTPKPKQSARFRAIKAGQKTFVQSYQTKDVKDNERNIKYDIIQQLPKGFIPYDCALEVDVLFTFPPPSAFSKKKLAELSQGVKFYKTTKPDLTDNLMKGLFDAMEGVVYVNDSRICKVKSEKIYGLIPMIEITINEIDN